MDRIEFTDMIVNRVCLDMIAEQTHKDSSKEKAKTNKNREPGLVFTSTLDAKLSAKTDECKRLFADLRGDVEQVVKRKLELLYAHEDKLKKELVNAEQGLQTNLSRLTTETSALRSELLAADAATNPEMVNQPTV